MASLTRISDEMFEEALDVGELDLSNKKLRDIPKQVFHHSKEWNKINLSNNNITELPSTFEELTNLEEINLYRNHFKEIPEQIKEFKYLYVLQCSRNQISTLPSWVAHITSLQVLNLSNNPLDKIEADLAPLTDLHSIDLSNTRLTQFPLSLCSLPNLRELKLNNSLIDSLPYQIGNLKNVVTLDLSSNSKLKHLPPQLSKLSNLKNLILENTELETPPPEVVAKGPEAVISYLRSLMVPAQPHLCEVIGKEMGKATTGKPSQFTIKAKTADEKLKKAGGDTFEVSLKHRGRPDLAAVAGTVVDNGDGTYFCQYTPVFAGDCELHVTLIGIHVLDSPFSVAVDGQSPPLPKEKSASRKSLLHTSPSESSESKNRSSKSKTVSEKESLIAPSSSESKVSSLALFSVFSSFGKKVLTGIDLIHLALLFTRDSTPDSVNALPSKLGFSDPLTHDQFPVLSENLSVPPSYVKNESVLTLLGTVWPEVDVAENLEKTGYLIEVDCPGLSRSNLTLDLFGSTILMIKGDRPFSLNFPESFRSFADKWERKRWFGPFIKLIEFASPVDSGSMRCTFRKGLLDIKVRKELIRPDDLRPTRIIFESK
eukprot:GCRY01004983.1.p1 GENE.GCRY01004983.1~~GCRY01004983.1.p1  ORF type:complete len:598 (-),score=64.73 GCRY01004983.1:309-2102(-)